MSWDIVCDTCGLLMDKSDDCRHADYCLGAPLALSSLILQIKDLIREKNINEERFRKLRDEVQDALTEATRHPEERALAFNLSQILKENP